jgi:hypothetical protein
MSATVQEPKVLTNDEAILGFVDCDVHPYTKSPADLDAFLPERWRKLRASIGPRSRSPFAAAPNCRPGPACAWIAGPRMAGIPAPISA